MEVQTFSNALRNCTTAVEVLEVFETLTIDRLSIMSETEVLEIKEKMRAYEGCLSWVIEEWLGGTINIKNYENLVAIHKLFKGNDDSLSLIATIASGAKHLVFGSVEVSELCRSEELGFSIVQITDKIGSDDYIVIDSDASMVEVMARILQMKRGNEDEDIAELRGYIEEAMVHSSPSEFFGGGCLTEGIQQPFKVYEFTWAYELSTFVL